MSSSCSTDEIPESIREIFNNPKAEDWFAVYYITRDRKIIAQHQFLFRGRDKIYKQKCVSDADGIFKELYIIYRGQTARYEPDPTYSLSDVAMGETFFMTINGEIIP